MTCRKIKALEIDCGNMSRNPYPNDILVDGRFLDISTIGELSQKMMKHGMMERMFVSLEYSPTWNDELSHMLNY